MEWLLFRWMPRNVWASWHPMWIDYHKRLQQRRKYNVNWSSSWSRTRRWMEVPCDWFENVWWRLMFFVRVSPGGFKRFCLTYTNYYLYHRQLPCWNIGKQCEILRHHEVKWYLIDDQKSGAEGSPWLPCILQVSKNSTYLNQSDGESHILSRSFTLLLQGAKNAYWDVISL